MFIFMKNMFKNHSKIRKKVENGNALYKKFENALCTINVIFNNSNLRLAL